MQNINEALDLIYRSLNILLDIDQSNLELTQKIAILRSIEQLEDARKVLYDEKNNLREAAESLYR